MAMRPTHELTEADIRDGARARREARWLNRNNTEAVLKQRRRARDQHPPTPDPDPPRDGGWMA